MAADLARMSEREYFAFVAERLGMFVVGSRLAGIEGFLDGYDHHALRHGGPGLSGWREWLVARRGQECGHGWAGQVRHIALLERCGQWELTRDEEAKVVEVLFTLLDEFLAVRGASDASDSSRTIGETG
ncbi:hypothetical protein [Nonomuraea sp. NPDC049784]|uniref:hypothetical protein n=1 Tax=Nonomuraea sp. NPDC049784 TaxID=3154361 RepID=UPI0033DA05EC